MASLTLSPKLPHKKPVDGLFEVFERLYVFDSCFRTETWKQEEYKGYVGRIITQFKDTNPEASVMIFNFREADRASKIHQILSGYFITIMDYPKHYEGFALVSMEVVLHHFLKSSESWFSLGQRYNLLVHIELGGWPVLPFLLAAVLLYRKHFTSANEALEMVHNQGPPDKLALMSALDPTASQLRYLQYVSKRNADEQWPPADKALKLDCVMMRMIPDFDGKGGCCPVFRIYGRNPLLKVDKTPKLLFSTPMFRKNIRSYNQAENELVKIDIKCNIQGDIVLECININDDMMKETIMYGGMFNTAFIESNKLMLNRDKVDISWNKKDRFPKDFKAELFFCEMDDTASEDWSWFGEEGLPVEAFGKVQEMNFNREEVDTCWDAKDKFPRDIKAKCPFSEMDATASVVPVDLCGFEAEGLPMEVFDMVQKMNPKVRDLQQSQIALEKEIKEERRAREALQQQVKELTRRLDNPFGTPSNS